MGSRIKRRNRAVNKMFAGKISVEEARRRAGGKAGRKAARKAAAPAVVKAQRVPGVDAALAGLTAELARLRPVTEADVIDAIRRPMVVPSAARPAKAARKSGGAARVRRGSPQQVLKALGDMQARTAMITAGPRVPPMSSWTSAQREMWRLAHEHHDPQEREGYRAALEKELADPGQGAVRNARALIWAPGPDGRFGWQAPQPVTPGLRIAPPGMAGR